ncbi:hypothetical protein MMC13_003923 [Lambiella insularis]|nr:hypothetical protein [Lambiella insularis]
MTDTKPSISPLARPRHKRRKIKTAAEVTVEAPTFPDVQSEPAVPQPSKSTNQVKDTRATASTVAATNDSVSEVLPPSLKHLQTRYAFATMSILSGSKINQKVRSLLAHLEKFSFADLKAIPGVVILHAKANVASKLVSIVEIAKREIEKQNGKLYQYSRVHGQLEELKQQQKKEQHQEIRTKDGRTLNERQAEQPTGVENQPEALENNTTIAKEDQEDGEEEGEEKEEEEEAFETMAERGREEEAVMQSGEPRKKVRAVPVMTVYLSRVPVPEFKQLYG